MLPVLAEGDDWIAVAKPPWIVVHRAKFGPRLPAALQIVRNQIGRSVWPIHRLDRQVSGCLLFGKTSEAAGRIHAELGEGRKRYVALVRGAWRLDEEEVVVETPMKDDNGILKDARSIVRVIATSDEPRCSLLLVEPRTGRYHQVRRHVRDLHHPVLGDAKHGDGKENRAWKARGVQRIALHCLSVEAGPIAVTCPLFEDLAVVLRAMPWWEEAVAKLPALGLPPILDRAQPPKPLVPVGT
ncbi:MAG: RluA family pseudouridine synthase [Myxococcota bacterium]